MNDVNAFLLGEAAWGAARGDDVLGVMLGFLGMEPTSWFVHRFLFHGVLWPLHVTHHRRGRSPFEWNDLFSLGFAAVAVALILGGTPSPLDSPAAGMRFVGAYHANSMVAGGPEDRAIADAARRHGMTVAMGVSERDGGTRMVMEATFETLEEMEKLAEMGMVEGIKEAVGQMDALLVD